MCNILSGEDRVTQLVGFKSHKLCKAKCLISPDKQGKHKLNILHMFDMRQDVHTYSLYSVHVYDTEVSGELFNTHQM